MGAACCRLSQENEQESRPQNYVSEEWIPSHHMQVSGRRIPSTNGVRDLVLPSEKGNVQRVHERRLTRPHKCHIVRPQHQQLVQVNSGGNTNRKDETHLKNEKGKSPYSGRDLKTPNDTCKESKRSNSLVLPAPEEEDFCPTCLEGYDEENPKILTKCNHHYHLPCILEWRERSNTCPTCEQVLVIDETCREQ